MKLKWYRVQLDGRAVEWQLREWSVGGRTIATVSSPFVPYPYRGKKNHFVTCLGKDLGTVKSAIQGKERVLLELAGKAVAHVSL